MHQRLIEVMLFRFRNPRPLMEGCSPFWEGVLGMSADSFAADFMQRQLLRRASFVEALCTVSTLPDLKSIAQSRGILATGTKSAIAERLAASANPPAVPQSIYLISEAGKILLERANQDWLAASNRVRAEAIEKVLGGRLQEALQLFKNHNQSWSLDHWLPANPLAVTLRDSEVVQDAGWILSNVPRLLASLPSRELHEVRLDAVLEVLASGGSGFAASTSKKTLSKGSFEGNAVSLYVSAASFERERDRWFKMFPKGRGEVLSCSDSKRCEACATLEGKRFSFKTMPSLPFAECTSPRGCRCTATWYDE
jgi:hypothetical protein